MTSERIERAVALLVVARRERKTMTNLPEDLRPRDEEEAYAMQDALCARLGIQATAWKIACTTDHAQAALNTDFPFRGPLPASAVYHSPARIPAENHFMRMVEGEFAFTLAEDLPADEGPFTRDQVAAALGTLHPAIEVADSRFEVWRAAGKPSLIADLAVSGALVVGEGLADWRSLDIASLMARMEVDGELVGEGPGSEALGHPVEAVLWLANHLSAWGLGLKTGQIVTTGTCTGNHMTAKGSTARATFEDLGAAEASFT
jgi:2-keto-4-pentenoate hydratase